MHKDEQLNKLLENLLKATNKNINEKRKNFEHMMLLIGTILGFSAGLSATTNGEPNFFLLLSWFTDVFVIIIGSIYLIFETESRYYRTLIGFPKQVDVIKKDTREELEEVVKTLKKDISKTFLDISSGKNLKEKTFIVFAKYQRQVEMFFYFGFIVALLFLVISFL
ncbi:MAG: hypothetical protein V1851_02715 [Patescibacteria group bacterium]